MLKQTNKPNEIDMFVCSKRDREKNSSTWMWRMGGKVLDWKLELNTGWSIWSAMCHVNFIVKWSAMLIYLNAKRGGHLACIQRHLLELNAIKLSTSNAKFHKWYSTQSRHTATVCAVFDCFQFALDFLLFALLSSRMHNLHQFIN